jgi:nicotinate-nucleotide--dimethylbenzimidazole phosphoribosyltransferase
MDILDKTLSGITPIDKAVEEAAWRRLDNLTKPKGSLGRLEELAAKYAAVRGDVMAKLEKPAILTFGADHGVADIGVSAFPKAVSVQMAANIAAGGAGVSVLSRHVGASLRMVDVGIASPCDFPGVVNRKVSSTGTADFTKGPAMSKEQCRKALEAGIEEANLAIDGGATIIGTGDLGIANTTPSAALYCAYLGMIPEEIAGRGTGIDDARLKCKIAAIKKAMEVNKSALSTPFDTLAALGGLEIAAICGSILGAAARHIPVVVDGFISGAAAVAAIKMKPEVMDYCIFSHASAEGGHLKAMNALGIDPLLGLDMRLGEGTGAALAIGIVEAANKILREMATFAEAGVSGKES